MYKYAILACLLIIAVSVVVNVQGNNSTQIPSVPTTSTQRQHSYSQTTNQAQVEGTKGKHIQTGTQDVGAQDNAAMSEMEWNQLMWLQFLNNGFNT